MIRLFTRNVAKRRFAINVGVGSGNGLVDRSRHLSVAMMESVSCSSRDETDYNESCSEVVRLKHMRNIGILAHVDAGKTTVTERMLALAGMIRMPGSVDGGSTVTDYLPAERERGITIQSAAVSFDWAWHSKIGKKDSVKINVIDTPGHVDFSVEVNRSVAVLDGAVLVIDAVAGVQAQTQTVWKVVSKSNEDNMSEALPSVAIINKMDKDDSDYFSSINSIKKKLRNANPVAVQLPLYRTKNSSNSSSSLFPDIESIFVGEQDNNGNFAGVVDLINMRAVIWPDMTQSQLQSIDSCNPKVINLLKKEGIPVDDDCDITKKAMKAQSSLIASLAEIDAAIEDYFLLDEIPSSSDILNALRRATLDRKIMPVLATAALKGKGIELLLDAIVDLLPSPIDCPPPVLISSENKEAQTIRKACHPLDSSLIAFVFKVLHMKGRGGSGDGRVVFARVYSGCIKTKDHLLCRSSEDSISAKPKIERVGGMLEIAGGRFNNIEDGICKSGEVAALIGLKNVKTGDTLTLAPSRQKSKGNNPDVWLAGFASPKPVLTVRIEAENSSEQSRLTHALDLLCTEDPSLLVEETESSTQLSGLGELHIEVTIDRLQREFGLNVVLGSPAVAYNETILHRIESSELHFDKTFGDHRVRASLHIAIEPRSSNDSLSHIVSLSEPIISIGCLAREFLEVEQSVPEETLFHTNEIFKSLIAGCQGTLRRGAIGPYPMSNMKCTILNIQCEGGLKSFSVFPGSLRAVAAHATSSLLNNNLPNFSLLEPSMAVEISVPRSKVGSVLSDFNNRRGSVEDVCIGDEHSFHHTNASITGNVPLIEILGYANSLRSLTAGEGHFTAEYIGHSPYNNR